MELPWEKNLKQSKKNEVSFLPTESPTELPTEYFVGKILR
jgi:hypothetical protein